MNTFLLGYGFLLSACTVVRPPAMAPPALDPRIPQWTVDNEAYASLVPGEGSIYISLAEQRLRLFDRERRAVLESDCSTGVDGKETPKGRFTILEKIVDKRSNIYGSYVSSDTGEVVAPRSWLVSKPPGTTFLGTAMPYWLRITWAGVGIHVGGFDRGHRTSMGCIRMPKDVQPLLYEKAVIGMPVWIN